MMKNWHGGLMFLSGFLLAAGVSVIYFTATGEPDLKCTWPVIEKSGVNAMEK